MLPFVLHIFRKLQGNYTMPGLDFSEKYPIEKVGPLETYGDDPNPCPRSPYSFPMDAEFKH